MSLLTQKGVIRQFPLKNTMANNSEAKFVKDKIDRVNQNFYHLIGRVLNLDLNRSIQVLTLLLNESIVSLYFPAYRSAIEVFRKENELTPDELIRREKINEIVCGFCLYLRLKYTSKITYKQFKTDISLDFLRELMVPFYKEFFVFNFLPLDFKLDIYKKLRDQFIIEYKFLPDLDFDPLFKRILESDSIKYLFHALNAEIISKEGLDSKYKPEIQKMAHLNEELFNSLKTPLEINPALTIADDARLFFQAYGIIYFGSKKLIDDIIDLFIDYYCERFLEKEDEIYNTLLCFGVLLKATEGKGYFAIKYATLKKRMSEEVDEGVAEFFLENYCTGTRNKILEDNWDKVDYKGLINEYKQFLKYTGFIHYGTIHMGCFLVWRSLIKYLESLQQSPTFRSLRGALLEAWAYEEAIKLGFLAEKLILINKNKDHPTDKYKRMKANVMQKKPP